MSKSNVIVFANLIAGSHQINSSQYNSANRIIILRYIQYKTADAMRKYRGWWNLQHIQPNPKSLHFEYWLYVFVALAVEKNAPQKEHTSSKPMPIYYICECCMMWSYNLMLCFTITSVLCAKVYLLLLPLLHHMIRLLQIGLTQIPSWWVDPTNPRSLLQTVTVPPDVLRVINNVCCVLILWVIWWIYFNGIKGIPKIVHGIRSLF